MTKRERPTPDGADADARDRGLDPAWFRRAVEAAGHAIFITDVDAEIVYVNPAFEEITGYAAAAAVGRTPNLLHSGHHATDYFRRLWETILAGDVWREEIVNRRADGEIYVANQTIAPIVDPADGVEGFVAIQTDVTDRREHERALERSQDLSNRTEETADVGGWELDLGAGELRWTAGTRRIHEVGPDYDPSLEDALAFYHPEDRETVRQLVDRALEWGVPYEVEARLVTAEGNTRLVQAAGERVDDDGETPLLRGTIKDVTESKSRRQQLMVFNRVLRHNLRNDLNVVLGHADRLRAAVRSVSVADDDPAVGSALAAVDDVVTATENLLETSERVRRFDRLSEEVTDYDPVAIRSLLERVAATYREAVPAATIRVEGPDHTVLVNPDAVRIAVAELVDNALEHGGDERPTITLRVVEGADGAIRVDVADRGQGMPAVERRVITAGTETPLEHGSGLGLWLVKWLVTAMGGTIDIADGERCGTVVSLEFPASRWRPGEGDATR